jgi:membrane associated rhomboid family serine protease
MGIHDRDYYRENTRGMFESWGGSRAVAYLIGVTVGVYIAQVVVRPLTDLCVYDPDEILRGEVWRLLTSVFLHSPHNPFHLIFNMFVLYWAGVRLEERYGGREFTLFYLAAGLFANLAKFLLQAAGVIESHSSLGASGAVTAAMVLYAFNWPHQRVLLFFVLPVPAFVLAIGYVALSALGVLGAGDQNVGHAAHFFGAVFGAAYFRFQWHLSGLIPRWPARGERRRVQPRLRVISPDPEPVREPVGAAVEAPPRPAAPHDEHFEAKVDAVLEKVAQHGQASLTAEEREILFRASELYKKKRK